MSIIYCASYTSIFTKVFNRSQKKGKKKVLGEAKSLDRSWLSITEWNGFAFTPLSDFPGRLQPSSFECKLQNQKHLKPDALKKWRENLRTHSMSLPNRVFLRGPGPWRAMQKEPLHICWKMESWSKNTKEGTETFQKRLGSGPRNKKRKIRF